MKKIVITGAKGLIGTILSDNLRNEYSLILLDKHNCDLTKLNSCLSAIPDKLDIIIHLAWDTKPIYENGVFYDDNFVMTHNVFEAAVKKKVKRVILASSVHANEFRSMSHLSRQWEPSLVRSSPYSRYSLTDTGNPKVAQNGHLRSSLVGNGLKPFPTQLNESWPTSIYGATKLYFEALGRYYAMHHDLEVVVIRFGGVNKDDSPTAVQEPDYDKIFLSHKDLVTAVKKAIKKKKLENNYWSFMVITG